MGSAPNPVKSSTVVPVSEDGDTHVFDVTYSGDDGKSVSLRDTVKQVDGVWKIVSLSSPS